MSEEAFSLLKRSQKRESNSPQTPSEDHEMLESIAALLKMREDSTYTLRSLFPGSYKADDFTLMINRQLPPHVFDLVMHHELIHFKFSRQSYGETITRLESLALLIAIPLLRIRGSTIVDIRHEEIGSKHKLNDDKVNEFYARVVRDPAMRQRIRDRLASDQLFMRGLQFLDQVDKRKRLFLAHWKRAQEGAAYWLGIQAYERQMVKHDESYKREATELVRIVKEKLLDAKDENGEGFRMVSEIANIWGADLIPLVIFVTMSVDITRLYILHASLADLSQKLSTPCFSPDHRLEAMYHMAVSNSFVPQKEGDIFTLYRLLDPECKNPKGLISSDEFNVYWNTIDADQELVSILNGYFQRIGSEQRYEPVFIPPGADPPTPEKVARDIAFLYGGLAPSKDLAREATFMDHEGQILHESVIEPEELQQVWLERARSANPLGPGEGPRRKRSMDKDIFLHTMREEGLV